MLTIKTDDAKWADTMGITLPDDATVMTVKDGEELLGLGVMRLYQDYALLDGIYIKDEFSDFSLEYGLGKSMLNVIDLRGIRHVASENPDIQKQLSALKFKPIEDIEDKADMPKEVLRCRMYLNLDGYFLANC